MPDGTIPTICDIAKPSRVNNSRRCFMCGAGRAYPISDIGPVCLACAAVCIEIVAGQCREGVRK
jgi:hypothetical protein